MNRRPIQYDKWPSVVEILDTALHVRHHQPIQPVKIAIHAKYVVNVKYVLPRSIVWCAPIRLYAQNVVFVVHVPFAWSVRSVPSAFSPENPGWIGKLKLFSGFSTHYDGYWYYYYINSRPTCSSCCPACNNCDVAPTNYYYITCAGCERRKADHQRILDSRMAKCFCFSEYQ